MSFKRVLQNIYVFRGKWGAHIGIMYFEVEVVTEVEVILLRINSGAPTPWDRGNCPSYPLSRGAEGASSALQYMTLLQMTNALALILIYCCR